MRSSAGVCTPGGVPIPTTSTPAQPGYFTWSGSYPIVYPAFTLQVQRTYANIGWGAVNPGCGGCHDYPPRTSAPANAAGAGDSHSWLDDWGYENMHNWDMGYDPLHCRTCHYATVTGTATFTRDSMDVATWGPLSIANAGAHVNGVNTVQFDTTNLITQPTTADLSKASWDPATRSCAAVDCHIHETSVTWGAPYRWENSTECNRCHQN